MINIIIFSIQFLQGFLRFSKPFFFVLFNAIFSMKEYYTLHEETISLFHTLNYCNII